MWPLVLKEVELTIVWKWLVFSEHWLRRVLCCKFEVYTIQHAYAYAWRSDQEKVAKRSDIWNSNSVLVLNYRSGLGTLLKNVIYISKGLPGLPLLSFLRSGFCIIVEWSEPCFGYLMTRPQARLDWSNFTPSVRFSGKTYSTWEEGGWGREKERHTAEHMVYKMCSGNEREKP